MLDRTALSAAAIALALVFAQASMAQTSATPPAAKPHAKTRGVTVLEPDDVARPQNAAPAPAPTDPVPPTPPTPPVVAPVAQTTTTTRPPRVCKRAFQTADLTFTDDAAFDQALSSKLKSSAGAQGVIVDVAGFAPDQPPARLQGWFGEIDKTGGKVGSKQIACTRGFSLMAVLKKMFSPPPPTPLRAIAKDYDATLWIEATSGQAAQVQFTRRTG